MRVLFSPHDDEVILNSGQNLRNTSEVDGDVDVYTSWKNEDNVHVENEEVEYAEEETGGGEQLYVVPEKGTDWNVEDVREIAGKRRRGRTLGSKKRRRKMMCGRTVDVELRTDLSEGDGSMKSHSDDDAE